MKITFSVVIDVDPRKWAEYNGVEREQVQDDVRTHCLTALQGSAILEESDATVTMRRRSTP